MKPKHYVLVFGFGALMYESTLGPDLQSQSIALLMVDKKTGPDAALGLNVPGGEVEEGETIHEAAAREYGEECRIFCDPMNFQHFHSMTLHNGVKVDSFWIRLAHAELIDIPETIDNGEELIAQRFWVTTGRGMVEITPVLPAGRWAKQMSYLIPMAFHCYNHPDLRPEM